MSKIRAGVLGATGMVGQRIVRLLNDHPYFEVAAMSGSERNNGKRYGDALRPAPAAWGSLGARIEDMVLVPSEPGAFEGCRVIFSALPADVARDLEPRLAQAGYAVVSNASSHRMSPDVPLLIPEVNPNHIRMVEQQKRNRAWSGYIVTNPNCSTISMTLALAPLYQEFGIEQVFVTTLQALSGAGYNGVSAMDIVDNVVPYIGGEEEKMETEPLKLLSRLVSGSGANTQLEAPRNLKISAQCTRVPTTDGHLEMVSVKLARPASAQDIVDCWEAWRPLPQQKGLPSAPAHPVVFLAENNRPQPRFDRDTEKGMATVIGRLRPCPLLDYKFALLGHNLLRGAAGGVVLIAELLYAEGLLS